jgi:hypothetical protein
MVFQMFKLFEWKTRNKIYSKTTNAAMKKFSRVFLIFFMIVAPRQLPKVSSASEVIYDNFSCEAPSPLLVQAWCETNGKFLNVTLDHIKPQNKLLVSFLILIGNFNILFYFFNTDDVRLFPKIRKRKISCHVQS